jgi:hypothetical protein
MFRNIFIILVKTVSCLFFATGLVYTLYVSAYVLSLGSIQNLPSWYSFSLSFLVLYFIYCVGCCLGLIHKKLLLLSGFSMHGILALSIVWVYGQTGNISLLYIAGFFTALWVMLYIAQTFSEFTNSANNLS